MALSLTLSSFFIISIIMWFNIELSDGIYIYLRICVVRCRTFWWCKYLSLPLTPPKVYIFFHCLYILGGFIVIVTLLKKFNGINL